MIHSELGKHRCRRTLVRDTKVDELLMARAPFPWQDVDALVAKAPPSTLRYLARSQELGALQPMNMARLTSSGNAYTRSDATFNNLYNSFYIHVWCYPTGTCPTNSSAVLAAPFVTRIPYVLFYGIEVAGGAQSIVGCYYTGSAWQYGGGSVLSLNAWHCYGFQLLTAQNIRCYIDGAEAPSNSGLPANGAAGAGQVFRIGARYDLAGASPYFPGRIAEVAIWNTTFTDSVQWRHHQALQKGASPLVVGNRANLVGYWPLWGLATNEPDLSGNARHMTVVGAPPAAAHAPEMRPPMLLAA